MRIISLGTLYPPHSIGGYEMNWRDIVAHLRARGHAVEVLCGDWSVADNGLAEDTGVHRDLRLHVDDLLDVRRDGLRAARGREQHNDATLLALLASFRPDVALLGPMGGGSFGLSRRLHERRIPQLAFVFDQWPAYRFRADRWQAALRHRGALADRTARRHGLPGRFRPQDIGDWVLISRHVLDAVVPAGVPPTRTTLLAPGPDAARFAPAPPRPWTGRLLYSGRLHPDKGVEFAIRALALLPDCTLTIKGGGDPRYRDRLHRVAQECSVTERVRFLDESGFDALPRLYAEADAVLFPSVWPEPWGLVPLEAMAVGRPVVASAVGGATEYLRAEANALVVPPADPEAIAGAVRRLAADPDLRERLRVGGTRTAAGYDYTGFLDAMADRVEALAPG